MLVVTQWSQYQEDVAEFFRSIDLEAETNVSLIGTRTSHDVDVVIQGSLAGLDLLWIVECKFWETRVSKLHVFALREIVHDLGADRGLLLAERGFQRGAFQAAQLTNVTLLSLPELKDSAGYDIAMVRLHELSDRIDGCLTRYWDITKEARIRLGLRPDAGQHGYSTVRLLEGARLIVDQAFRGSWPTQPPPLYVDPELNITADTPEDVFDRVDPLVTSVERSLAEAENHLEKDG